MYYFTLAMTNKTYFMGVGIYTHLLYFSYLRNNAHTFLSNDVLVLYLLTTKVSIDFSRFDIDCWR